MTPEQSIVTPMVMLRLDTMQDVRGWLEWAAERITACEPTDDLTERLSLVTMTESLAELIRQTGHAITSSPLVFFRMVNLQSADAVPMPPRTPDEPSH